MNNKVTMPELAGQLSETNSLISRKGWENFLRLFFGEITEGLSADRMVKVKGLGTFKAVTVEARKSVNVQTGAEVIIPPHTKVSFTPDPVLAQTINKPFAHLETYVLNPNGPVDSEEKGEDIDDAVVDGAEISSVNSEVSEVGSVVANENAVVAEEVNDTEINDEVVESPKAVEEVADPLVESDIVKDDGEIADEVVSRVEVQEEVKETPVGSLVTEEVDSETEENVVVEEATVAAEETSNKDIAEQGNIASITDDQEMLSGKKLGVAILVFVVLMVGVGGALWKYDPNLVDKIREKVVSLQGTEDLPQQDEQVQAIPNEEVGENAVIAKDSIDVVDDSTIVIDENAQQVADAVTDFVEKTLEDDNGAESDAQTVSPKPTENKSVVTANGGVHFKKDFVNYMKKKHPNISLADEGEPDEVVMGKGSRLTLVALEHYGAKDFWIYIYLYNQDKIKNPNHIQNGMRLKVPKLSSDLINSERQELINLANEIRRLYDK